jgi:chromosome segregation ATPase
LNHPVRGTDMPEWASHAITGLASAAGLAALAAAYVRIFGARHGWRRQDRQDGVDVLQMAIRDLRRDRDATKTEFTAYRTTMAHEMAELKSEHTACLLAAEGLRVTVGHLRQENEEQEQRITHLEAEVARLRGDIHGGN